MVKFYISYLVFVDAVLADCKLGVKILLLSQPALCFVLDDASLKITLLSQPSVLRSG